MFRLIRHTITRRGQDKLADLITHIPIFGAFSDIYEMLIDAVLLHKLLMRPALRYTSVVYNEYLIRTANGRETMCDGNYRFTACKLGDSLLNEVLILRVNACRSLVEYDDRRILEYRTGNGYMLTLAARECSAALSDNGIIALRQL